MTGYFNEDKIEDFAALIRNNAKRKSERGGEYYLGKKVVCHGLGKKQYRCQVLGEFAVFLPYETHLYRVGPGKVGCPKGNGTAAYVMGKRDSIGYGMVNSNAAGVYIYQPDGTYFNCAGE